jgi:hypothetical protein
VSLLGQLFLVAFVVWDRCAGAVGVIYETDDWVGRANFYWRGGVAD